jgi:hypothetical protein
MASIFFACASLIVALGLLRSIQFDIAAGEAAITYRGQVQADGLAVFRNGFVILPENLVVHAQVVMHASVSWIDAHKDFHCALRLLQIANASVIILSLDGQSFYLTHALAQFVCLLQII